jgi:hypothetical protein
MRLGLAAVEFAFFEVADDELVLRVRRRRDAALLLVVLGRVLRNAPRTSSSGSCAVTSNTPHAREIKLNNTMKGFDLIFEIPPTGRVGLNLQAFRAPSLVGFFRSIKKPD